MNQSKETVYKEMLKNRYYLYRPWIPICKSIEAEVMRSLKFEGPVLDIGCGNGLFGTYAFQEKIDVGLDYDSNAIEAAKKSGVYKEARHGDARAIPFDKDSFNTVLSVCALEHISQLGKVFSEIKRILKPGGRLIFTVPSKEFGDYLFASTLLRGIGLKKQADKYGHQKNVNSGHIHVYPVEEWKEGLGKEGFEVQSIGHIFPKEAVFMWSFFHSLPFKILFLPFRVARELKVKFIDNVLFFILTRTLSGWLKNRSSICQSGGGYLLIQARRPA